MGGSLERLVTQVIHCIYVPSPTSARRKGFTSRSLADEWNDSLLCAPYRVIGRVVRERLALCEAIRARENAGACAGA